MTCHTTNGAVHWCSLTGQNEGYDAITNKTFKLQQLIKEAEEVSKASRFQANTKSKRKLANNQPKG